jgi:hypothetical protein
METSAGHVWTFSRLSLSCPFVLEISVPTVDVIPVNLQQSKVMFHSPSQKVKADSRSTTLPDADIYL